MELLKNGSAFLVWALLACTLLMAFPIVVVMLWVRVLELVAYLLFGGV